MWKVLILYCSIEDPSRATECIVQGELTARLETEQECEAIRDLPREVDYIVNQTHPVQRYECWKERDDPKEDPTVGWVIFKPVPSIDLSGNHRSINKDDHR